MGEELVERRPIATLPTEPTDWIIVYGLDEDADLYAAALKKPTWLHSLDESVEWLWWSYLPTLTEEVADGG